jgi:hypothetical protein
MSNEEKAAEEAKDKAKPKTNEEKAAEKRAKDADEIYKVRGHGPVSEEQHKKNMEEAIIKDDTICVRCGQKYKRFFQDGLQRHQVSGCPNCGMAPPHDDRGHMVNAPEKKSK